VGREQGPQTVLILAKKLADPIQKFKRAGPNPPKWTFFRQILVAEIECC
jgi:hypothetical protein